MQRVWNHLCQQEESFNIKYSRICSKHFIESNYERNLKHDVLGYTPEKYPLKKDAVPLINLSKISKQKSDFTRAKRQDKRQQQKFVKDILGSR